MTPVRAVRAHLSRALALPLVALGLLAAILVIEVHELSGLSRWVEHTDRVIAQAHDVGRDLSERESALRGSLLVHSPQMAESYDSAGASLSADLDALERLVADNPAQLQRVGTLRTLAAEWAGLAAAAQGGRGPLPAQVPRGREVGSRLRSELALFTGVERRLLDERTARARSWARLVVWATVLLSIALGVSLGLLGRRQLQEIAHLYERLLRASRETIRLREDFLTIAAHELRTPITSLFLDLQLLERTARADGAVALGSSRAVHHTRRLIAMIESLLEASALAADAPVELRRVPAELGAVVRRALARVAHEVDAARGRVVVSAPEPVEGLWDEERLEHAIGALIANGAKFGDGKPVEVSVGAEDGVAFVRVTDRGIGIPFEDQAKIFGRFARGVSPRGYGGFGLGLFVARRIAELHDGQVEVQSAPGEGATFTLRLPRGTAPADLRVS